MARQATDDDGATYRTILSDLASEPGYDRFLWDFEEWMDVVGDRVDYLDRIVEGAQ